MANIHGHKRSGRTKLRLNYKQRHMANATDALPLSRSNKNKSEDDLPTSLMCLASLSTPQMLDLGGTAVQLYYTAVQL